MPQGALRFVAVCLGSLAMNAGAAALERTPRAGAPPVRSGAGVRPPLAPATLALRRDCELDQPARYCAKRERRGGARRARKRYA